MPFERAPFARVALALVLLSYLPTLRVAVSLLRCVDVGDLRLLRRYPTVSCRRLSYKALLGVSLSFSLTLLGGAVGLVLLRGQRWYREYAADPAQATAKLRRRI